MTPRSFIFANSVMSTFIITAPDDCLLCTQEVVKNRLVDLLDKNVGSSYPTLTILTFLSTLTFVGLYERYLAVGIIIWSRRARSSICTSVVYTTLYPFSNVIVSHSIKRRLSSN
jgi:hypothetical protein